MMPFGLEGKRGSGLQGIENDKNPKKTEKHYKYVQVKWLKSKGELIKNIFFIEGSIR